MSEKERSYYSNKTQKKDVPADRLFSSKQKEDCWAKSDKIPGRDPERWRIDPAGNVVLRKLTGCMGCLCYDYDHIVPYSKGGKTIVENCQILQTRVNRSKSNLTGVADNNLRLWSCASALSEREMDTIEMAVYGSVDRQGLQCIARSIRDMEDLTKHFRRPEGAPTGCYE